MSDENVLDIQAKRYVSPKTKLAWLTHALLIFLAICIEPLFLGLAGFCADGSSVSNVQLAICVPFIGFLPLLVALAIITASRFALSHKREDLALAIPLIPIAAVAFFLVRGHH